MNRPLLITDCDEVLLHMVSHFSAWLAEAEGVICDLDCAEFFRSMRRKGADGSAGELLDETEMWALLGRFFDDQMHRQTPVPGAIETIKAIREHADVVVLTNLQDHRREAREMQLLEHGLDLRVFTNQGPKGPALQAILDEYRPSRAVFVDDISQHHDSVGAIAPEVRRLHLCAEPRIAGFIPCAFEAGHAHARIDDWNEARAWLFEQLDLEMQS